MHCTLAWSEIGPGVPIPSLHLSSISSSILVFGAYSILVFWYSGRLFDVCRSSTLYLVRKMYPYARTFHGAVLTSLVNEMIPE